MEEIPLGIARFLGRLVVGTFLILTGEVLLFVLTLGRRKPCWDRGEHVPQWKSFIFTKISLWIGAAFWLAVAAVIHRAMA